MPTPSRRLATPIRSIAGVWWRGGRPASCEPASRDAQLAEPAAAGETRVVFVEELDRGLRVLPAVVDAVTAVEVHEPHALHLGAELDDGGSPGAQDLVVALLQRTALGAGGKRFDATHRHFRLLDRRA